MRHRKANRKLGRRSGPRRALLRNLVTSLFLADPTEDHGERIITTPAKAKEARRLAEKLITLGKKGTLAARRRALQLLPNKRAVRKLFQDIAPRYADRPGGYTRILHLGKHRVGDNAPQVIFELLGANEETASPRPVVETTARRSPAAPAEPEAPAPEAPEAADDADNAAPPEPESPPEADTRDENHAPPET